jgi:hypothetical protein
VRAALTDFFGVGESGVLGEEVELSCAQLSAREVHALLSV